MNPAANKITGYSKEELLEMSTLDFIDPESPGLCYQSLYQVKNFGTCKIDLQFANKEGSIRWWSSDAVKLSETTYLGFVKDITERKKIEKEVQESEERYRVLVKQMLDAIVISTIDGQILSVNENACTITGYSEKELLTKSIYDFVANDEVLIKPLQFEKLHLGLSVQSERKIVLNENKVLYAELNSKLLHDGTVLTIVRDITERKTAESLLVENEQFLLETQRIASIGTFSINLATDVWTRSKLLDVIFGTNSNDAFNSYSYSWLSLVHPDHKEIMIKYITEEVLEKKQAFIINNILDFSKIEAGKLELNIEEVDLYELVHQTIHLFKFQAQQKQIDLTLTIQEQVPRYILADSLRLKQVLVNLINNALKFTSFGQIHLDLKVIKIQEKLYSILFSVKDTGIGIKVKNQKKIFQFLKIQKTQFLKMKRF